MVPLGQPRSLRAPARRSVFHRIVFPSAASPGSSSSALATARDTLPTVACSRCLANGHWRVNCKGPIHCRAFRKPGHVAAVCNNSKIFRADKDLGKSKNEAADVLKTWFGIDALGQPSSPSPHVFNSFADMAHSFWPT